jgi:hypothetical protein
VLIEALKLQQSTIEELSAALTQGKESNSQLNAALNKQQQLLQAQQMMIRQLQLDRSEMQMDIMEIKQSLGLEAKN